MIIKTLHNSQGDVMENIVFSLMSLSHIQYPVIHDKMLHKLVHHFPLWPLEPLSDKHQLCFKCYRVFRFTIVTFNYLVKGVITGAPPTVFHSGQIMNKLPLTRNT